MVSVTSLAPSVTFLIGLVILDKLLLRSPKSIPKAFFNNVFLASDILLIMPVKNSDNGVKIALASSKSPIINLQV